MMFRAWQLYCYTTNTTRVLLPILLRLRLVGRYTDMNMSREWAMLFVRKTIDANSPVKESTGTLRRYGRCFIAYLTVNVYFL